MLQVPSLAADCNISHFITTRHGGVSEGTFASFNPCLYGADDEAAVKENRSRLAEAVGLPFERLMAARQVHGDRILVLDEAFAALTADEQRARLDGSDGWITRVPDLCLTVQTADCVPLLFYDPVLKVVAAAHAGWRGTALKIGAKCVQLMKTAFGCRPENLRAGIGPSIGLKAFEVGDEVVDAFAVIGTPMEQVMYRDASTGKAHLDLWEINRLQLLDAGLLAGHIEVAGICTFTACEDFFSARRLGIRSGRICSGIFLKGEACERQGE